MQLNVWLGRLTPQIVKLIAAEKPDILTTQEIFNAGGQVVFPDNTFDCLSQIKAAGSYENIFFSPIATLDVGHQKSSLW